MCRRLFVWSSMLFDCYGGDFWSNYGVFICYVLFGDKENGVVILLLLYVVVNLEIISNIYDCGVISCNLCCLIGSKCIEKLGYLG